MNPFTFLQSYRTSERYLLPPVVVFTFRTLYMDSCGCIFLLYYVIKYILYQFYEYMFLRLVCSFYTSHEKEIHTLASELPDKSSMSSLNC